MRDIVLCSVPSLAQQERCGSIGTSNEAAAMPSRVQFFYLNTANPANCTGNITSWRVCYYGPDTIDAMGEYWATYVIYQRMVSDDKRIVYMCVSKMFRAIRSVASVTIYPRVDGEITQGGFNSIDCSNWRHTGCLRF